MEWLLKKQLSIRHLTGLEPIPSTCQSRLRAPRAAPHPSAASRWGRARGRCRRRSPARLRPKVTASAPGQPSAALTERPGESHAGQGRAAAGRRDAARSHRRRRRRRGRSRSRQLPPLPAAASTRGPPGTAVPRRPCPALYGPRAEEPACRAPDPAGPPGCPRGGCIAAGPARRRAGGAARGAGGLRRPVLPQAAPPRRGGRAAGGAPCPYLCERRRCRSGRRLHLWRGTGGASPAGPRPQRQPEQRGKCGPFPFPFGGLKAEVALSHGPRPARQAGRQGRRGRSSAPPGFASAVPPSRAPVSKLLQKRFHVENLGSRPESREASAEWQPVSVLAMCPNQKCFQQRLPFNVATRSRCSSILKNKQTKPQEIFRVHWPK